MAIVISKGNQNEHLININQLENGKANVIAESIINEIDKYKNLIEKISLICHDTPRVNTGVHSGVIVRLINHYKLINKFLFNAPCRNHIDELIASAVYITLFGKPQGPIYPLFVKFQNVFDQLNLNEPESCEFEIQNECEIIQYIDYQLSLNQKRADYKEVLQLSRMFVNSTMVYPIKKPGADTQSRWLSKFIYCLKMYLFRKDLRKIKFDCSFTKLRHFCMFGVQVYLKSFFENCVSTKSVLNDLNKFKEIKSFYHSDIKKAAFNSFQNHLDYLVTNLSTFAFFDERIESSDKEKMVCNLFNNETQIREITNDTKIYDLINSSNLNFLNSLILIF
jgi:hypothetical protein